MVVKDIERDDIEFICKVNIKIYNQIIKYINYYIFIRLSTQGQ